MARAKIGLIGLGAMGANLAHNLIDHDISVVAFHLDPEARLRGRSTVHGIDVVDDLDAVIGGLERPRRIMLMVPAGAAVDAALDGLKKHLSPGDIVIDIGNSNAADTTRRQATFDALGVGILGVGISGGPRGAREGGAIMAGGDDAIHAAVADILTAVAASADGKPCAGWIGPGAAGHITKTVHNGIEYAEMQALAEARLVLRTAFGMEDADVAAIMEQWSDAGDGSFLMEVSIDILRHREATDATPVLDGLADRVGEKGTGRWCVALALELGVAVPSIAAAVAARSLSATRPTPAVTRQKHAKTAITLNHVRTAVVASRHAAFAQGFQLLARAAITDGWPGDLAAIAHLWRAGSILRGDTIEIWHAELRKSPDPWTVLSRILASGSVGSAGTWADLLAVAANANVPIPVMSASLQYLVAANAPRLGADLLQAQRDYFGAHGVTAQDGTARHIDWHGMDDGA